MHTFLSFLAEFMFTNKTFDFAEQIIPWSPCGQLPWEDPSAYFPLLKVDKHTTN